MTKHYEWLQAKNYWFVPVVAATSGTLHPETMRLLYDFARLKRDAAEQHAVANSLRLPLTPEHSASSAALLSLDSGWRPSCTASGPQLHGSLGSTGLRPMPPHYSRDFGHGPGAGSGLLPRLPPPTCSRPVSGVSLGLLLLVFFTAVSRPLLAHCFSLCDLRLLAVNGCLSLNIEIFPFPRGPRARRLLVCLAWDLSSLTPSLRASLLARLLSTVIPVFPARCQVSFSREHKGRAHCKFCRDFFVQVVRVYTIDTLQVLDGALPTSDEGGLRAGAGVPGLESLLSIEGRPASDKHVTLRTLIKLQAYP